MRSGTSYFNRTLFAKHFARFWPVWGLYGLIWLVCLPLNILLQSRDGWTLVRARLLPLNYLDGGGGPSAAVFLAAVFGLLAAMGVFSYLYSARSAGLFHALPLRREGLFLTSWLAGLGFLLLPNLAVFLLSLLLEAAGGAVAFSSLFTWLVTSSLLGLFFYSFAVFCAMFTGHTLALPAFYVILNGLAGGLVFLFNAVAGQFLFGFDGLPWLEEAALWLSPALRLAVACRVVYPSVPAGDGVAALNEAAAYFAGLGPVALYALVGLVLAGLALAVYRRRQVETAGDVVSVAWVRPVFKYGVAFCAAAALGVFFYTLFADLLPRGTWGLLAVMLLWGAVGYFVAEMLLRKKFRVFRDSWRGCAALLACLCLGMCLMEFDALGYESRVPDPAQVASVQIVGLYNAPGDDGNFWNGVTAEDQEEIALVTQLHQAVVDHRNTPLGEDDKRVNLDLVYTMKNGTVMTRSYDYGQVVCRREDSGRPGTVAYAVEQLLADRDLVWQSYRLDAAQGLLDEGGRVMNADYRWDGGLSGQTEALSDLPATVAEPTQDEAAQTEWSFHGDDAQALWEAMVQDFRDGAIGVRDLWGDAGGDSPTRAILFTVAGREISLSGPAALNEVTLSIAVPDTAVRTLAALEALGATV